jgi:hypothetical protein
VPLINFVKSQVLCDVTLVSLCEWFPTFRNTSGVNFVKMGSVTVILYLGVSISVRTFYIS